MFFRSVKKIWTDFSSVLSQCTRLTDRRTDGRTDRNLIARPRLHSMQRGNKTSLVSCQRLAYNKSLTRVIMSFEMHIRTGPSSQPPYQRPEIIRLASRFSSAAAGLTRSRDSQTGPARRLYGFQLTAHVASDRGVICSLDRQLSPSFASRPRCAGMLID